MAGLIASADFVVGSPGSSSFERALLGMPSILLPTADNQSFVAEAFAEIGAARVLPASMLNDPDALGHEISAVVESRQLRRDMSRAAAALTDGRGAQRLMLAIATSRETGKEALSLRLAETSDEDWLFALQRQPTTRQYARTPQVPSANGHAAWFRATLDNVDRMLMIVEAKGTQAGCFVSTALGPRH